jgi:hypothetical protein
MTQPEPNKLGRLFSSGELSAQLTNVVNRSAYEDTVVWAIFGTFWAANALLLVALFSRGDFPQNPGVGVVISIAGTIVGVAWFLIQRRAIAHLARYERIIALLEIELQVPDDFRLTGDKHRENIQGVSARTVMNGFTRSALGGWVLGLLCFVWVTVGFPVPWR